MNFESYFEHIPSTLGAYVYRIKSTGYSSARYGACEVCSKPCSDVFYQVEGRTYDAERGTPHEIAETNWTLAVNSHGWLCVTHHECKNYFGHEECLRSKRR